MSSNRRQILKKSAFGVIKKIPRVCPRSNFTWRTSPRFWPCGCLPLQILLFSSIMAKAMTALVVFAASFLMFSALGMNRAVVPASGGGGGGGGPNMIKAAGAAAATYQATSPPSLPLLMRAICADPTGNLRMRTVLQQKSHFHRKQVQTGFALKQLQTNKDEKSLQCHFR